MNKPIKIGIIAVCLIAIAVGGWNIFRIQSEYKKGQNAYDALNQAVSEEELTTRDEDFSGWDPNSETDAETVPVVSEFPDVDFAALREINPNIVAWIYSPDTPISYPVVQGSDNDFYLHHMFNGDENGAGCLFLDVNNSSDFSDPNSIIYGHNMRDGSMFNSLVQYTDKAYYDAHSTILLLTPEKNYKLDVFSCYILSGWGDAWRVKFNSDADYYAWLMQSWEATGTETNFKPEEGDRIVTLSTCAYQFEDARYVVLGILREVA